MNILINEVFKNGATKVYVDLVVKNKKNDFISRFFILEEQAVPFYLMH